MTAEENIGTLRLLVVLNTLPDKQDEQVELLNVMCAAVRAEAVADERERALTEAADEVRTEIRWQVEQHLRTADLSNRGFIGRLEMLEQVLRGRAAGSVPVATPEPPKRAEPPDWFNMITSAGIAGPVATSEPSEPYRACAGCDGPDLCKFCGYRVATPTELLSDELLDKWAAAVTLPGEYAAQLVDEVRRLRAAVASPIPTVQPEER